MIEGRENFIGSNVKVHKTPGDPVLTLSKSELEEPKDIIGTSYSWDS